MSKFRQPELHLFSNQFMDYKSVELILKIMVKINDSTSGNTSSHFDFSRSCRRLLFGEQPEGETYHRSDR